MRIPPIMECDIGNAAFAAAVRGRHRRARIDIDAIDYPAATVALVTALGLVLPGQKSVMYGSAASTRVTLTTCAYGLFIGGIGSLWR
jgi:hypothetical protein